MKTKLEVARQLILMVWSQGSWWLAPIVLGVIVVGVLALAAAASPLSPFLYPLF